MHFLVFLFRNGDIVKVVYLSLTGKTRQFVKKLGWDFIEISKKNPTLQMKEPYIVITPTYGDQVANFFTNLLILKRTESC
jgi:ribonucleotide reductase stimulatory protein nrdI